MLLEVVLSICLYYMRSFYPVLSSLTRAEVAANREVQLEAVTTLHQVCTELVGIVKENGRAFALFTSDLLGRCKLQKVVLHSLLTGVHKLAGTGKPDAEKFYTEEILSFNEREGDCTDTEAFQGELLKLVCAIVLLEAAVVERRGDEVGKAGAQAGAPPTLGHPAPPTLKYQPELPLCAQPMFLTAVLSALRQSALRPLHRQWTGLVAACLPALGPALPVALPALAAQLWTSLEQLPAGNTAPVTTDYVLTLLESLGHLLSFCLLDAPAPGLVTNPAPGPALLPAPPSVMANLVHALGGGGAGQGRAGPGEARQAARTALISTCPRLLASLSSLWSALSPPAPAWLSGSPASLRAATLDLLSPLATAHPNHFLAAVAVAWAGQCGGQTEAGQETKIPEGPGLVELVAGLKMFPVSLLTSTLAGVVRSPPPTTGLPPGQALHTAALQFYCSYLAQCSPAQLGECWPQVLQFTSLHCTVMLWL